MDSVKMGQMIAKLRKKQNLTQAQLGEKLNVTDKTVSKWERGNRTPDISILNDLSRILKITTTELLDSEQIETPALKRLFLDHSSETQYFKDVSEALLLFLNNHYENCYVYFIQSQDHNYYINGLIIQSNEKEFINIHSIEKLSNDSMNLESAYSYEYSLNIQSNSIYKLGNISLYQHHHHKVAIPINDILSEIKIYVAIDTKESYTLVEKPNLTIKYINQELQEKDIQIPLLTQEILANHKVTYKDTTYF